MSQLIDPLILFIASNAIFLALGAVFSTISNELFILEKEKDVYSAKYNDKSAYFLREYLVSIIRYSVIVYSILFLLLTIILQIKYIFNFSKEKIYTTELFFLFIVIISIFTLLLNALILFNKYFKMRSEYFKGKLNT